MWPLLHALLPQATQAKERDGSSFYQILYTFSMDAPDQKEVALAGAARCLLMEFPASVIK
jgi:hypothetical protein